MTKVERIAVAVATAWLAMVLAIIGLALMAGVAQAAPIPSGINGVYLAPERTCRIEFARYQVHWVQLDMRCLHHGDGTQSHSLATLYAPGQCPTESVAWVIDPRMTLAVHEYISIRAVLPDRLHVVLGTDSTSVSNGIGIAQTWMRVDSIGSPGPYVCGDPAPRLRPFGR